MNLRKKVCLSVSAASIAITAAVSVGAPPVGEQSQKDADVKALHDEVNQLRAEVKTLKEQQHKDESKPGQVGTQQSGTADALGREADRRSQFPDTTGISAGWSEKKGFFLASDDNNFLLSPFVLFQGRYAATWRENEKSRGSDDTQNGFEVRRLQLGIDGHAFSPDLTYRVFWQSSEITTGNLSLLMAWFQYRIHDTPWVIGGGQFKSPLDHEQFTSDASLLAVDRTFTDDILASGEAFSKGVTVRYDDGGPLRAEAAFTNGFNNNNDNFQSFPTNPATFGVGGRVEYKLMGRWQDYSHFTSEGNDDTLLVVGGGFDWTEGGHTNAYRHAVDVQYNPGPVGLYAAYLGRYTSGNTTGRGGDTYDPSLRLQASYLITPHWEGFGRYDYVHLDGKEFAAGTQSTVQEFTGGVNYYFYSQRAKLTFDLSYLLKGTPISDIGNDILASPGRGELIFRGMFQLQL